MLLGVSNSPPFPETRRLRLCPRSLSIRLSVDMGLFPALACCEERPPGLSVWACVEAYESGGQRVGAPVLPGRGWARAAAVLSCMCGLASVLQVPLSP